MRPRELEYDGLSWKYFEGILAEYHPQFPAPLGRRLYLPMAPTKDAYPEEYYKKIQGLAQSSNFRPWKNLFLTYLDFTSGSTGEKKDCFRPSVSIHLEILRLRDILDYFAQQKTLRFARKIYYYSRYGADTFRYIDKALPSLEIAKYVYDNLGDLYDDLLKQEEPFILSGTPSSIVDLLEIGFDYFSPELVILAGEECPVDVRINIEQKLAPTINLIVTREFGLLGCECPTSGAFHFFTNSVKCMGDGSGRLRVTEPLNYCMNYKNYSVDDYIEGFANRKCVCGFYGAYASAYRGRAYRKPYPPL
jgi:hypothetical protein